MYAGRVEITFDAGHRILGHAGKCAAPHGHTFRTEIFIAAAQTDALGFIVDFAHLKAPLKAWIDQHWDHGFLLNDQDAVLCDALSRVPEAKLYRFAGRNPSAEEMARELFCQARRQLGCVVQRVRVWETSSQYADFADSQAMPAAAALEGAHP